MKLILLPGMDGTGKLFDEFLSYYDGDFAVIPLPESGPQDPEVLAGFILSRFPDENFILLAESFSGSIVPSLIKRTDSRIRGVIFVVSFLSCPKPILVCIAKWLPIKVLAGIPGMGFFHRLIFLGSSASSEVLDDFRAVVASVSALTLENRLRAMKDLPRELGFSTDIPCVYIRPTRDLLVSKEKMVEIERVFNISSHIYVDGPHFILQSKPYEMAAQVMLAVRNLTSAG